MSRDIEDLPCLAETGSGNSGRLASALDDAGNCMVYGRARARDLRPERPNHVWAYDFVEDRTRYGRKFRMLNVVDEFTRECLAIRVGRKLKAADVIDVLADLFILRGEAAQGSGHGVAGVAAEGCPDTSARTTGRSSRLWRAGGKTGGIAHAARPARANRISPTQARRALTFRPDHPVGARQLSKENDVPPICSSRPGTAIRQHAKCGRTQISASINTPLPCCGMVVLNNRARRDASTGAADRPGPLSAAW